jgi:hypothetical protein
MMKKKVKRLWLSKETVKNLDLRHATGAAGTDRCEETERSICLTICPSCGETNYPNCYSYATDCYTCFTKP